MILPIHRTCRGAACQSSIGLIGVMCAVLIAGCSDSPAGPGAAVPTVPTAASGTTPPPTPEAIETTLDAAGTYFNQQNFPAAETILLKLLERVPTESRARELLGQVLLVQASAAERRGEKAEAGALRERALEQYRLAIAEKPSSAGLHQSAASVALAAGEVEEALRLFQKAGELDATSAQSPLYEAQVLIRLKRYDEARAAIDRVFAINADEPFAYATLAGLELERGNNELAIEHIVEARQIDAQNMALRIQEARIRRRTGDPARGVQILAGLSDDDRVREAVASELAECFAAMGDNDRAAAAWEHRLGRDPTAWLAAARAGAYHLKAGRRDRARLLYDQAVLIAPRAEEVQGLGEMF